MGISSARCVWMNESPIRPNMDLSNFVLNLGHHHIETPDLMAMSQKTSNVCCLLFGKYILPGTFNCRYVHRHRTYQATSVTTQMSSYVKNFICKPAYMISSIHYPPSPSIHQTYLVLCNCKEMVAISKNYDSTKMYKYTYIPVLHARRHWNITPRNMSVRWRLQMLENSSKIQVSSRGTVFMYIKGIDRDLALPKLADPTFPDQMSLTFANARPDCKVGHPGLPKKFLGSFLTIVL